MVGSCGELRRRTLAANKREKQCGGVVGSPMRRASPHFDGTRGEAALRVPTVTTDEFEEMDDSTAVAILRVRYRVLTGFGLDPEEAAVMAADPELRLVEVIDFLRRGFPARTALRIVLDAHASHPVRSAS